MPRRKCVFNKLLQQMYPFLKQVEDASHLHCQKCGGRFSISSGGRNDIKVHIKTKKHQKSMDATLSTENKSKFYIVPSKKKSKPKDIEMCRICAKFANDLSGMNLFHKDQDNLLVKIKDLTDFSLSNERDLPKYICRDCEVDLQRAHNFRTRCLDTQSYFFSAEYKEQLKQKSSAHIYNINENNGMKPEEVEEVLIDVKEEAKLTDFVENDMLEITNEPKNLSSNEILPIKTELECSPDINIDGLNQNITDTESEKPSEVFSNVNDFMQKPDFICDRCGNHFISRQHFNVHLRRHMNNKLFNCEVCPKQCYTSSELKRHMRCHTGERPFACQYCQRRFTDYSTRVKHERTHRNERPYACSQCGKAFTTTYVLKNHMLVHTGERSFKCLLCNKDFQRQTHLTVHFRSIMHKEMLEKQKQQNTTAINESK